MNWVREHIDRGDGFPRADWDAVGPRILVEFPEAERDAAWDAAGRVWLEEMARSLGEGSRVDESERILLLTCLPARQAAALLASLDASARRIAREILPGIVGEEQRHAVLVFADAEKYTSYIAHFHPEQGEFGATSGMHLTAAPGSQWWYSHCVAFGTEVSRLETVLAHELVHDALADLPIPVGSTRGSPAPSSNSSSDGRLSSSRGRISTCTARGGARAASRTSGRGSRSTARTTARGSRTNWPRWRCARSRATWRGSARS